MNKKYCSHCGNEIEEGIQTCPLCNAPTSLKTVSTEKKILNKFTYYFIGLVIFCFLVIWIAPREL
jgi:hypothetical protein